MPGTVTVIAGVEAPLLDAFATTVTLHASAEGHRVLYASGRANRIDVALRLAAAASKVPFVACWRGRLRAQEWTRLHAASTALKGRPVLVLDHPHLNVEAVRSALIEGPAVHDELAAVLLIERLSDHSTEPLENTIAGLLDLASEAGAAVLAIERTRWPSPERADPRPVVDDLPHVNLWVQHATTIILVHDHSVLDAQSEDRGTIEANVVLNRLGHLGMVRLAYPSEIGVIADLHSETAAHIARPTPERSNRHQGER
jgi:replicative DNA helicase